MAITGQWEENTLTLMSVYDPPGVQRNTFKELGSILISFPDGLLVVGGDFNSIVSGSLDRYPPRELRPLYHWLPDFLEALGLADVWRVYHPDQVQHTFHSGAHNSLSRIEYLLVPASQVTNIQEVRHVARGISDHSLVWVHLVVGQTRVGKIAPINPWYL